MHKLQQTKAQSLRGARQFLDQHAKVVGAVNDTPARRQLDAAVAAVGAAGRQQGARVRQMRGEARRQRSLERDLRETHLVPMAKFARAHLSRDGNIAALAPKLKNLGGHRLARMAEAMATSGVPFRGKFAEAGYPAGFLEEASAAAQALVASIDRRSALRNDRVAATVGIAAALEQGRQAIAMLDPVVGRIIAGNEGLVSGWKHAKRISAVPGPVRQSKRGRARKKN